MLLFVAQISNMDRMNVCDMKFITQNTKIKNRGHSSVFFE